MASSRLRGAGPRLDPSGACLAVLAAPWLLACACQRVPEEPAPAPASKPAAEAPRREGAPGRCMQPLPAAAGPVPPPASACPPDPDPVATLPRVSLSIPDAPQAPRLSAELARTSAEQAKGLMYRRSLGEEAAMLFVMPLRRVQEFWMRNTCIALDMLFLDDDGFITGIVENAAPLTDDLRSVDCPSRYVLEVRGGWSRQYGVRPGQRVALPEGLR